KILHPFVPFVSEEIWQNLKTRSSKEALIISSWPETTDFDGSIIREFEFASEVVSGIRNIRKQKNIPYKDKIEFLALITEDTSREFDPVIVKLGNLSEIAYVEGPVDGALSFRVKSNEYFIPVSGAINIEAEKLKLEEELAYSRGFLKSVEKKLSNERFVNNAPAKVVEIEQNKKKDAEAKIKAILLSLKALG
ncbi:MAG TPA: class I tRNA ligase family protein, partial [Salinimicrobium sp.]|nr:class I tRNA ligase family protein [Salinimicrobium sp.]